MTETRIWYATRVEVFAPPPDLVVLELTGGEASLLARVLHGYLSDLRMEIVGTDNPAMRRDLKSEERILKTIRSQLTPTTQ